MGAMLWSYVGPGIFTVGIVGNLLILIAVSQRKMRGTSTCVYLQCMAVADLAVLLTGMIPEWLEARNIVTVKVTWLCDSLQSWSCHGSTMVPSSLFAAVYTAKETKTNYCLDWQRL